MNCPVELKGRCHRKGAKVALQDLEYNMGKIIVVGVIVGIVAALGSVAVLTLVGVDLSPAVIGGIAGGIGGAIGTTVARRAK